MGMAPWAIKFTPHTATPCPASSAAGAGGECVLRGTRRVAADTGGFLTAAKSGLVGERVQPPKNTTEGAALAVAGASTSERGLEARAAARDQWDSSID